MEFPKKFQDNLRSFIDFSTFILFDMYVVNVKRSIVFLVPKHEGRDPFSVQINDTHSYFCTFDQMIEFAKFHKLVPDGYEKELIKRYKKLKEEKRK